MSGSGFGSCRPRIRDCTALPPSLPRAEPSFVPLSPGDTTSHTSREKKKGGSQWRKTDVPSNDAGMGEGEGIGLAGWCLVVEGTHQTGPRPLPATLRYNETHVNLWRDPMPADELTPGVGALETLVVEGPLGLRLRGARRDAPRPGL